MVTADAIKEVERLALAAAAPVTIDGVQYAAAKLTDPRQPDPAPSALTVATLTSFVDYVRTNRDRLVAEECLVHIVDHATVSLYSRLQGRFQQRFTYLTAHCAPRMGEAFRFGAWATLETMNIAVQALFADAGDRAKVLKLIGTVTDDEVRVQADDGVTQRVTAKSGISVLAEVPVPNPVRLAPFRTFAEVLQPVSPFILRVRKGQDGAQAALFEADGGAWKLEAIQAIRQFLTKELPTDLAVLA